MADCCRYCQVHKHETGAVKEVIKENGRYDLIPVEGLIRLAKRYEFGLQKYPADNWKKGIPKETCINSFFRHFVKYLKGEKDEDHLAACAFWIFALIYYEEK